MLFTFFELASECHALRYNYLFANSFRNLFLFFPFILIILLIVYFHGKVLLIFHEILKHCLHIHFLFFLLYIDHRLSFALSRFFFLLTRQMQNLFINQRSILLHQPENLKYLIVKFSLFLFNFKAKPVRKWYYCLGRVGFWYTYLILFQIQASLPQLHQFGFHFSNIFRKSHRLLYSWQTIDIEKISIIINKKVPQFIRFFCYIFSIKYTDTMIYTMHDLLLLKRAICRILKYQFITSLLNITLSTLNINCQGYIIFVLLAYYEINILIFQTIYVIIIPIILIWQNGKQNAIFYALHQRQIIFNLEFIRQKCIKDHFKGKLNDNFKHSSIYNSDYKQKLKELKPIGWNFRAAKQISQQHNEAQENVSPFVSVYRRSFQNTQTPAREIPNHKRNHFIKTESCEPLQSFYDFQNKNMLRSLALNENSPVYKLQKGKAQIDNLIVPKYNKMNTKSLYTDSYENYSKFPSLYMKNKKVLQCNSKDEGKKIRI